ncbi:serine/threonine-protein kinase [Streptomyces narbonensis]|uniref:Serine/threonine-protein kinase n=1 Tax=Streptomyces narbonensis TaxID=67333 RepID=A0ABV3CH11_9ACTN
MLEPLDASAVRRVGPYVLIGRIGAGGMGTVHLARREGTAGPAGLAAVKTVREDACPDTEFRLRFRREVDAARAVRSPFTAVLIDAAQDAAPPWLATEYVTGPSLAEAVTRHGPLPLDVVRALGADLARALRAIHGARIVHRDLKPANVLCDAAGPKVIDFGIARAFDGTVLTAAGMAVGTLGFMSPEQLDGTGSVGPASDVFSLGVLLCWAATGRGPFDDAEPAAVIARIAEGRADLRLVPDGLRELVGACLSVAPNARPTTDALVRAFDARAAGERPGALFARSEEPFPWPAGVRELIGAYEAKTREVVASAPLVPAVPSAAVPVPVPPDGPPRRSRTRVRVAVTAVAAVLAVTATLVGVRLLARDDGDGKGTGAAPSPSTAGRPTAPPDPVEPMANGGGLGAITWAYPEPGTRGAERPKGWKPWHATAGAHVDGCVLGVDLLVCSDKKGVEARRPADGKLVWRHAAPVRAGGAVMTAGLSGDRVYLPEGGGVLVARRSDARPLAHWPGVAGFLPELAVAAGGRVYVAYEGAGGGGLPGEMLFRAYRESDGQRIWETKVQEAYPNSMTPAAGRLYLAGPGGTWQLDQRDGRLRVVGERTATDLVGPDGTFYKWVKDDTTQIRDGGTLRVRGGFPGRPLTADASTAVSLYETQTETGKLRELIGSRSGDGTVLWRTLWDGTGFMDRGQALVVGRRLVLINGSGVETRSMADGAPIAFVRPASWPDLSDPEVPLTLVAGDVVFVVKDTGLWSVRLP